MHGCSNFYGAGNVRLQSANDEYEPEADSIYCHFYFYRSYGGNKNYIDCEFVDMAMASYCFHCAICNYMRYMAVCKSAQQFPGYKTAKGFQRGKKNVFADSDFAGCNDAPLPAAD